MRAPDKNTHDTLPGAPHTAPPPLPPPRAEHFLLSILKETTLLIAVEDNTTVMRAAPGALLGDGASSERCVTVSSYLEAVGVLAAHKAGVNPACLTTDVPAIRQMLPVEGAGEGVGEGVVANLEGVVANLEGLQALAA